MTDFEFHNPTRILFGKDQIAKINLHIPQGKRIMLLYGGGSILRNGVYEKIRKAIAGDVRSAELLLDRAFGKIKQQTELSGSIATAPITGIQIILDDSKT